MEFGSKIRQYRVQANLSQEELSERVYVSRQTISNWENEKSCPDVKSLILLSEIFHVSLDQLIKGDIENMKKEIRREDVARLKQYSWWMLGMMLLAAVCLGLLQKPLGNWAWLPFGALTGLAMAFALKAEKIKKNENIHTYREITAFYEGRRLDEQEQQIERAKAPYQTVLQFLCGALAGAAVMALISWILSLLHWI